MRNPVTPFPGCGGDQSNSAGSSRCWEAFWITLSLSTASQGSREDSSLCCGSEPTALWDRVSSPHCTDGVAEDPMGGELQAAMSQRGSWEGARPCLLSLEATACVSSSRWCLGKRGQQAAACHREDPPCAHRPATAPCRLAGPRAHRLHAELAFRAQEEAHVA